MKPCGERRYSSTTLDFVISWDPSASGRDGLTLAERAPSAHWRRGWVGPRAGLDGVEKRKIPYPCRRSTSAVEPVARRYTNGVQNAGN
jgi:hypothetical protein